MDYFNYNITSNRLPSFIPNLGKGTTSETYQLGVSRTITNTIEYKWDIQNLHNFVALAGHEYSDYNYKDFGASGGGLTVDKLILLSSTTLDRNVSQSKYAYAYNSFFGRATYNYDTRYFFDATLRQDESSRFGKNNKKANFWSIGGKWNVTKENFIKDVTWINDLNLRASTGTQGNSAIDNYESLSTVSPSIYDNASAWAISSPGNPYLAWEKQYKTTVGVSTTLFKRINLDVEYFYRVTKNMLLSVPYPYSTGYNQITENIGGLTNRGVNIDFSVDVLKGKDYYFTPYVKLGVVNQKVTELFDNKNYWVVPNTSVSYVVGRPVEFFAPIQAGVNPENGLMQWYVPGSDISKTNKDPNNVTSEFSSTALQQSTGIKRYPPFNGGFGFSSGYKGFFVNADFTFSNGKYLINNDKYFFANPYQFAGNNQMREILDYWKKPGDVTKYPKYGQVNQFDTGILENASFLRLKGLSVGYNLPKYLLAKQKFFTGAKVYYTGRNLFTATKYTGPDPEVDSNLTYGRNPNTKQSVFGIELLF